ncbi:MAG: amylo-alpha-1,6-glucosidase [bacterium]|nr:amylo-alpha-1,6-glucosidase [bacterium]
MSDSSSADTEWLLTDGLGGYACGTVADLPRRRYHAAWVARATPTARRHNIVAGFDERIAVGDEVVSLLHAHWSGMAGAVPPPVETRFRRWPEPTFSFRHGAFAIERAVQLVREPVPTLLVRWRNAGDRPLRLDVRPLLGWCDADHLIRAHDGFDGSVTASGASWGVRPDTLLPRLWITADGVAAFRAEPDWYRGFVYGADRDRGYDHEGDRYCPGVLELDLPPGGASVVAFRLEEPCHEPGVAWDAARTAPPGGTSRERLARAADDFFYEAPGGRLGILAGFPWFGEWGRDVFLALPGLSLARGRTELCERVIGDAIPFLRRGLLPNIYAAKRADSHFGSCDAALWFALAVQRLADGGSGDPVRLENEFVPALEHIADAYLEGTDLGLAAQSDGLLAAGGPELNATWMDAQTSAGPVTPREGFPVEIQALWYALLAFLVERGVARAARYREVMLACGAAFKDGFWLAEPKYLADRVHDGVPDPAIRPNMLVAAALARSPLTKTQRVGVVSMAATELVTPCGLRTLSPQSVAYRPRYGGGIEARDAAYHQGTVWPWPIGFYAEAALRAASPKQLPTVVSDLRRLLEGLGAELDRAGLEHVSEVFDGDPPHRPGGTFAQAWNTGEILRAHALLDAAAADLEATAKVGKST